MPLTNINDAWIIFNPAAGRLRHGGMARLIEVVHIFKQAGITAELHATDAPGSATHLAHAAVNQQRGMVIACGGDGTLHEVVNGMAGSQVPLALLPAGTANVLAKELRISWDLREAARQLVGGQVRRIALGQAIPQDNGAEPHYFITLAGAGVDADMVHRVDPALKKRYGVGAYWVAGFQQFLNYRYPAFRVKSDCGEQVGSYIAIGRTKAHGFPVNITDGADLYSDQFEAAVFSNKSSGRAFIHGCAALLGRLRRMPDVHFSRCREILCTPVNGDTIHVQADGELIGTLPMTFRIVPNALSLVIPS